MIVACVVGCADAPSTERPDTYADPEDTAWSLSTTEPPTRVTTLPAEPAPPLVLCINEFVADNSDGWLDEVHANPDWIELHNPGDVTLSLADHYLTDDGEDPFKEPLDPSLEIEAGGFLLLVADGRPELGPGHLGFSLSRLGESVGLFREDGMGEVLHFGPVERDFAWARSPDCCSSMPDCAEQVWYGTPGASNVE